MPWGRGDPKAWGYCCSRAPLSLEAAPCTPHPTPCLANYSCGWRRLRPPMATGQPWGVDLEAGVTDQLLTSVTTDVGSQRCGGGPHAPATCSQVASSRPQSLLPRPRGQAQAQPWACLLCFSRLREPAPGGRNGGCSFPPTWDLECAQVTLDGHGTWPGHMPPRIPPGMPS